MGEFTIPGESSIREKRRDVTWRILGSAHCSWMRHDAMKQDSPVTYYKLVIIVYHHSAIYQSLC